MARFSTSSARVKKSCLEVYACSVDGCGFTVRPRLPKRRSKHCRPAPCTESCSVHNRPVSHIACRAILAIETTSDNPHLLTFSHQGYHRHPKPEALRPSAQAMHALAHIILRLLLAPKQLQMGTITRPASGDIRRSLANVDRLRYLKAKIMKLPASSLSEVLAFEKKIGEKLFVCIGSDALCLHTAFMQERGAANLPCRRPPRSTNTIPKLGALVDWETFGIPWGFTSGGIRFINTCPMDRGLMSHDCLTAIRVMGLISKEKYSEARLLWLTGNDVPTKPNSNVVDLFDSLENILHRFVPNLFAFTAVQTSYCTSEHYPERLSRLKTRRPGFDVLPEDLDAEDSSLSVDQSMVDSFVGDTVTSCTQRADEAFRASKPDSASFGMLDVPHHYRPASQMMRNQASTL